MKQPSSETYEQFKLRRQVENERTDSLLGPRWFWNSSEKGTYVRVAKPAVERPKRTPKTKVRERNRRSGTAKRRDMGRKLD